MTPYWPTSIPQGILLSYSGSVTDARASFDTLGGPITRPRTTAPIGMFAVKPVPMSRGDFAAFEAWVNDDLHGGALAFCLRDPMRIEPRMWKIVAGDELYQHSMLSTDLVQVSLSLVRLPALPWFAPYVPQGVSRVPDFVADYAEGVFGIKGQKRPASALTNIAGKYLTVTTDGASVTRKIETLTAGDIPATAPAGVTSIIGFAA